MEGGELCWHLKSQDRKTERQKDRKTKFLLISGIFTVWADPVKGSFKVPIKSIFNSFFTCL